MENNTYSDIDQISAGSHLDDNGNESTSNGNKFEVGDRVRSRISGWFATVTMSGRTIVQVKFDSADNSLRPRAYAVRDLDFA